MRLAVLVVFALAFGIAGAYQTLSPGYFSYYNVTAAGNSSVFAGLYTSSPVKLVVIRSEYFGDWANGGSVPEIYSSDVGSGIYRVGVQTGSYTVIFDAISEAQMSGGVVAYRNGGARLVNITGRYSQWLNLSNNSVVNITVMADRDFGTYPIEMNVSSQLIKVDGNGNLEFLDFTLNKGDHLISMGVGSPAEVLLGVSHSASLVNPVAGYDGKASAGVASYGVYNDSGVLVPYQVSTSGLVGVANITAIDARAVGSVGNLSEYGASLQLNIELQTHYGSAPRVLWLQDVADFNTSSQRFYMVDNIWNNTLPDADIGGNSLRGMGNVTECVPCGNQEFYAYYYPEGYFNYSLPLSLKLVMLENQTANGTLLSFGYQKLQSGAGGAGPLVFYDRVLLAGYYNSTMLVTPYYYTPSEGNVSGNYYDAELVFGGQSGGAEAAFSSLGASMWIYYYNGTGLAAFPSAYTFGSDTRESASGIKVMPSAGGQGAVATTGLLNPKEQVVVGNAVLQEAQYVQRTSENVSPPTTVFALDLGSGLQKAEIAQYAVYALIAAAILMLARLVARRR